MIKNKTVFVGVSGGVDSSVSATLLKDQGYNVVGVFIRTWSPDFIEPARPSHSGRCTWKNERRDAMRVSAHLNIPFLECDAEKEYKKSVVDYMVEEYKKGNTPNPDVMCNREVKFGVFWEFAKSHGADFIATGHYTRVIKNSFREATGGGVPFLGTPKNGVKELREKLFFMERGVDLSKDQSYFLWTLTQDDLSHTLFPVGHLNKTEVRKLAKKYNLPTAMKKDSQGVCFLGPLDMKDFLKHYIKTKKGDVILARREGGNEKRPARPHDNSASLPYESWQGAGGKVIGNHDGAVFFTLGERHGFNITEKIEKDKPYYVIGKDVKKNTITVSTTPEKFLFSGPRLPAKVLKQAGMREDEEPDHKNKNFSGFIIFTSNTNWILDIPKKDKVYNAQIRYHGELLSCKVKVQNNKKAQIIFDKNVLVDKGQSIVVYDGDICLGG
ncbi:MAG: tRNA 2-thiouridine(34) synthase MnmA, partial [Candidatus Paceibacterota bacterium]